MPINSKPAHYTAQRSATAAQTLHDDIRAQWDKFSDFEVGTLKDADDLARQVAARYALDLEQAQGDVKALLGGRKL